LPLPQRPAAVFAVAALAEPLAAQPDMVAEGCNGSIVAERAVAAPKAVAREHESRQTDQSVTTVAAPNAPPTPWIVTLVSYASTGHSACMNAVATILDEKILAFRTAFLSSSRRLFFRPDGVAVHNGEFGCYREELVRALVAQFAPERMAVDTGFIVTAQGGLSTQCDIVLYDRRCTPLIRNHDRQRFFPVESVCAVGEVKSVLGFSAAKEALRKLAAVKGMRDGLYRPSYVHSLKDSAHPTYAPETDELDQIVTFLVCERLDFDAGVRLGELQEAYVEAQPKRPSCHRHNLLLSVADGLGAYALEDGTMYAFPSRARSVIGEGGNRALRSNPLRNRWISPPPNSIEHVRLFCSLLHTALAVVSVLFPDLARYIQSSDDVRVADFDFKPAW